MNTFTLTVLIPSYRPGKELKELLRRLSRQKKRPDRVLILNTEDDILICDPEGEYAPLIEAMGGMGSVIRVSAGGRDRLRPLTEGSWQERTAP